MTADLEARAGAYSERAANLISGTRLPVRYSGWG
jgi:hypothetical protein